MDSFGKVFGRLLGGCKVNGRQVGGERGERERKRRKCWVSVEGRDPTYHRAGVHDDTEPVVALQLGLKHESLEQRHCGSVLG